MALAINRTLARCAQQVCSRQAGAIVKAHAAKVYNIATPIISKVRGPTNPIRRTFATDTPIPKKIDGPSHTISKLDWKTYVTVGLSGLTFGITVEWCYEKVEEWVIDNPSPPKTIEGESPKAEGDKPSETPSEPKSPTNRSA